MKQKAEEDVAGLLKRGYRALKEGGKTDEAVGFSAQVL